jgi:hypothetical protein
MTSHIGPGDGILYMKVGTHAQETLDDIIARKTKEIEDEGFALWGYGGSTCHPRTMVQPFVSVINETGHSIRLCMEEMVSKHFADPIRADKMSSDGIEWQDIPTGVNCNGSRYALVINNLHKEEFELPLLQTEVAVGPSQGRIGVNYIKGQVDKACFRVLDQAQISNTAEIAIRKIGLVADVVEPYAVFLKNTD